MAEKIITTTRVRDNDGTAWDASFVEVDGIKRGIVRQDYRTGQWVAEMMGCYKTQDASKTFGRFGCGSKAIDAIVTATARYPKYVVYPDADPNVALNYRALGVAHA